MVSVALVPHQLKKEAADLTREAIEWLTARGHEARVPEEDAGRAGLEQWACPTSALTAGLDLAIAVGGDGTMLRTVDLVCNADVPVLGVNVGRLGYLTEVEPAGLRLALEAFIAGDYNVDERMTLRIDIDRAGSGGPMSEHTAMNETVLEKTVSGNTVHLAISINDGPFLTTAADGLIVATPTGSTAYNFSARGPVVSPLLRALVMTPVSPHTLFDRSLVLDDGESIRLEVIDDRPASIVVDGQSLGILQPGDAVTCRAGEHDARFVTFTARDFHQILKTKFSLADR